jgi:predicted heme/steroid binding protein
MIFGINIGELLGWLLVITLTGTILNYCIKFVNKQFGKSIQKNETAKNVMKFLMKIFVKNHRFFGMGTIVLLLLHFLVQFTTYGPNLTGTLAAILLFIQAGLGMYGSIKKKPRKGLWFIAHRIIAIAIVMAVVLHLTLPYSLNGLIKTDTSNDVVTETESLEDEMDTASSEEVDEDEDTVEDADADAVEEVDVEADEKAVEEEAELPTFTREELAKFNGEDGNKAYVAYEGLVYDVTDVPQWKNGKHNGQIAGTDITGIMENAPHGTSKLEGLTIVGKME